MNKLIVFSKHFKEMSPPQLVETAHALGCDGYDLCVRPGYPVNPDNAADKLVETAELFRRNGLDIPMVTGNFDLLWPDHPTAEPILAAMNAADVRLIKLGYYRFDPVEADYWAEVDRIRSGFDRWQELARKYDVTVCYHTHSNRCMGLNCGMLAHLIHGFDPRRIGAYLDAGHLLREGEEFAVGAAIVGEHLRIVAVKDVLLSRADKNGHGSTSSFMALAGQGMVDWTAVFETLVRIGFDGPVSVHCEFAADEAEFLPSAQREVAFFRRLLAAAQDGQGTKPP